MRLLSEHQSIRASEHQSIRASEHQSIRASASSKLAKIIIILNVVMFSVEAQNTFTATAVKADTISSSVTKTDSLSSGIHQTDSLIVNKDAYITQNLKVGGNFEVSGNTNIAGNLKLHNALFFDTIANLTVTKNSNGNFFVLGGGSLPGLPVIPLPSCPTMPTNLGATIVSNAIICQSQMAPGVSGGLILGAEYPTGRGMIDVYGLATGNTLPDLLINYHCKRNTLINVNGGGVFMGDFVNMQKHLEIGDSTWGTTDAGNINIESHGNNGIANIRAKTWSVTMPQLSVFNTNIGTSGAIYAYNGRNTFAVYGNGKTVIRSLDNTQPLLSIGKFNSASNTDAGIETFKVFADGRTYIGTKKVNVSNQHADAILQVAGKIGCMELVVLDPSTKWSDFVFSDKYKLMNIKDLANYIKVNKHLPDVPTEKNIENNGIEINKILPILLQKIEENTLYIIELNKKIELLEEENNKLKNK